MNDAQLIKVFKQWEEECKALQYNPQTEQWTDYWCIAYRRRPEYECIARREQPRLANILYESSNCFLGNLFSRGMQEEFLCVDCFYNRCIEYIHPMKQCLDDRDYSPTSHVYKHMFDPVRFPLENNDCLRCIVKVS